MTDPEFLDAETRAAVDALVHRLRNRGDADDEPFAAEFIAALKGRGWRPTNARPAPDWHQRPAGHRGTPPGAIAKLIAGDLEAARAELGTESVIPPGARVTGGQPVLREDDGAA